MASAKQSLKVIACEIAQREICWLAAQTPHLLDLEFLPVGHHDDPKNGHQDLQNRIDRIAPGQYDAILIGYGICNQMVNGLTTPHTQLIIPRAHDCITFFLGNKERYQEVFGSHPGTFFFTAGWLEFAQRKALHQSGAGAMREAADHLGDQTPAFGLDKTFTELVAKYGEDNARYLMEISGRWSQNYGCGALIGFDFDAALALPEKVQRICTQRQWRYEELRGNLDLLRRWLAGDWPETDFLVVPPGYQVQPVYDERILEAAPIATIKKSDFSA